MVAGRPGDGSMIERRLVETAGYLAIPRREPNVGIQRRRRCGAASRGPTLGPPERRDCFGGDDPCHVGGGLRQLRWPGPGPCSGPQSGGPPRVHHHRAGGTIPQHGSRGTRQTVRRPTRGRSRGTVPLLTSLGLLRLHGYRSPVLPCLGHDRGGTGDHRQRPLRRAIGKQILSRETMHG